MLGCDSIRITKITIIYAGALFGNLLETAQLTWTARRLTGDISIICRRINSQLVMVKFIDKDVEFHLPGFFVAEQHLFLPRDIAIEESN